MSKSIERMEQYLPPLTARGRHWARFLLLAAALLLLLALAFKLRAVLTPLLAALALAYIFNPLITYLERLRIRRLVSVTALYIVATVLILTAGVVLTGRVMSQLSDLREQFPALVDATTEWLRKNPYLNSPEFVSFWTTTPIPSPEAASQPIFDSASQPATSPAAQTQPTSSPAQDDFWLALKPMVREHGMAVLNTAILYSQRALFSAYAILSLVVLIPMYAFFFLWRFNDIVRVVRDHIPAAYREKIVHVCRTIDQAIADFFRGRLVVCLLIGLCAGIGWQAIGLRKGLLLGLLAGVLNLVPFMSVLALIPALFFAFLQATAAGQPWAMPVVLTMGVFVAVQALESFVLSPLIESHANGLHPITTVVALLIGAEAAGLLGMLLAIPIASTIKTLAAQFLLPRIRQLAAEPIAPAPLAAAPPPAPAPHPVSPAVPSSEASPLVKEPRPDGPR